MYEREQYCHLDVVHGHCAKCGGAYIIISVWKRSLLHMLHHAIHYKMFVTMIDICDIKYLSLMITSPTQTSFKYQIYADHRSVIKFVNNESSLAKINRMHTSTYFVFGSTHISPCCYDGSNLHLKSPTFDWTSRRLAQACSSPKQEVYVNNKPKFNQLTLN